MVYDFDHSLSRVQSNCSFCQKRRTLSMFICGVPAFFRNQNNKTSWNKNDIQDSIHYSITRTRLQFSMEMTSHQYSENEFNQNWWLIPFTFGLYTPFMSCEEWETVYVNKLINTVAALALKLHIYERKEKLWKLQVISKLNFWHKDCNGMPFREWNQK